MNLKWETESVSKFCNPNTPSETTTENRKKDRKIYRFPQLQFCAECIDVLFSLPLLFFITKRNGAAGGRRTRWEDVRIISFDIGLQQEQQA